MTPLPEVPYLPGTCQESPNPPVKVDWIDSVTTQLFLTTCNVYIELPTVIRQVLICGYRERKTDFLRINWILSLPVTD